ATPDVHRSILDDRKLNRPHQKGKIIDSHDVIHWMIAQTCNNIKQLQPLYSSQGKDYCHRMQAAFDNQDFLNDDKQLQLYLSVLQQRQNHTLEELYGINPKLSMSAAINPATIPQIQDYLRILEFLRKNFNGSNYASHRLVLQEVEHERELEFE